jgi:hypothetical protein
MFVQIASIRRGYAVWASLAKAGRIASSQGKASETPAALSSVRRGSKRLVAVGIRFILALLIVAAYSSAMRFGRHLF